MKIIYIILIAIIITVGAFFLSMSNISTMGAAFFLLGMCPVVFIIALAYTAVLVEYKKEKFVQVFCLTLLACYAVAFVTAFLLTSDSRWGLGYAFIEALNAILSLYLLFCLILIAGVYSLLFVFLKKRSSKKIPQDTP